MCLGRLTTRLTISLPRRDYNKHVVNQIFILLGLKNRIVFNVHNFCWESSFFVLGKQNSSIEVEYFFEVIR